MAAADLDTQLEALPTAAENAALILATPANKLATNVDGSVDATATVDETAIAAAVAGAIDLSGIEAKLAAIELATGADTSKITVSIFTHDRNNNAVSNADVWITVAEDGSGEKLSPSTSSDTGYSTHYLDAGSYFIQRSKGNGRFGDPEALTVSAT